MLQDKFEFRLAESAHGEQDDKDYVFTAEYNNGVYTVSFQGESVDFTEDEVDQWINEGFWILTEEV